MTAPVQVGPSTVGGPTPPVTLRQTQVLTLASTGLSYYQIGRSLGITENTVDVHMRDLFKRLGAHNLPHAVLLACHAGILDGRPQRHGDHAGFIAHQRRGEDPWACELGCPEGEREYRRGRRAARKPHSA